MDFIDSELVILEVHKHPCIYDIKSEHYKDRQMRIDAWIIISKSLGEEFEALELEERNKIGKYK
jgi:hypothetical protein